MTATAASAGSPVGVPPQHRPGRHCASTAAADLCRYHGLPWSEAFCFGLGAGLGTWYVGLPGASPSRLTHVRALGFEDALFRRIGCEQVWQSDSDRDRSEAGLREALARGLPALVLTDIRHLPYYETDTRFPGHCIVVWSYDDERGVFWVTDTERPAALPVPYAAMRQARYARGMGPGHEGDWFAPARLDAPADLAAKVHEAIVAQARALHGSDNPMSGMGALASWQNELASWSSFSDWQWTARFAYQILERRGTGGGAFRRMYAEFLDEAERLLPAVGALGLPALMRTAAAAWTDLALALKAASEREQPQWQETRAALDQVAAAEATIWNRVLEELA